MIILFIHQNFPGQYQHLARHFAGQPGVRSIFITQSKHREIPGVEKIIYEPDPPTGLGGHPFTADFDHAMRIGMAVASVCKELASKGIKPDIICGHNGWGEMLFVKDVFPDTPILSYFEFYYHAEGLDVGFDPEFDNRATDRFRLRSRNAVNLLGFDAADWGNTPSAWQRSVHPPELRSRITVLHEGVDTEAVRPDPSAWLVLPREDVVLNREVEVVTFVARNLEPYRGFHTFMRAAAEILRRRPNARVVIAGGDEVSYGARLGSGLTYREHMLAELNGALDLSRLHFVGKVPYDTYLRLLQVSAVHVYLTYPFVLSWSFIEALACGCAVVGSDTPPVKEILRDGENGLIVNFFSPSAIADRVDEVLDRPDLSAALRLAARKTAVETFDLKSRQLPLWGRLIDDLVARRRPALFPGAAGRPKEEA